jgi:hypothetical protein
MKKNYLLLATAAIAMAGCANDDYIGDGSTTQGENQAIGFNMNTPAVSRAEGTPTDASKLGNTFIVWGEKNETTDGVKATAANTVFQNYVVRYTANTANTTTSNTNNWEYVGVDHANFDTNVISTIGSDNAQTIKYWDDNASSYTFTAVSASENDVKDGKVIITKTVGDETAQTGKTACDKGYTVQVKSGASTGSIYYADRVNIEKGSGYTHQPVQLTFRNFQSKIRFGIYETVPGYKVVITGLKYKNGETDVEHKSTDTDKSFGATGNFVVTGDNTKYTVTYENNGRAKVAVDGNSSTQTYCNTTGTNWLSTSWTDKTTHTCISETATAPTYDLTTGSEGNQTVGAYTAILPNTANATNLKLELSYCLYSEDTGEKIDAGYKTVEVPAQYCQWKPNFAYTYLFKITDKSAELYPITFDAVVVANETGNQETITTVSEPSITTFTVSGGNYVTNENEYKKNDEIYATVVEGSKVVALSSSNTKLYTVTTTSSTNYPITEASVAHALDHTSASTNVKATEVTSPTFTTSVPTEDGSTITLSNSGAALKWTATDAEVYAVEYSKTVDGKTTKTYKIVRINNATGQSN